MGVIARGTAVIVDKDTGRAFEIASSELHWQPIESVVPGMDMERRYEAWVEHPVLGILKWSLWEYPPVAENMKQASTNGHTLERDFDYWVVKEAEKPAAPAREKKKAAAKTKSPAKKPARNKTKRTAKSTAPRKAKAAAKTTKPKPRKPAPKKTKAAKKKSAPKKDKKAAQKKPVKKPAKKKTARKKR